MKKRILLSILCICMVLTMMPTLAFADVVAATPKGVTPEFENTNAYVKIQDATEAIFKVKNFVDYDEYGTWNVYEYKDVSPVMKTVTAAYNATEKSLKLTSSSGPVCNGYYVSYTPSGGTESESVCIGVLYKESPEINKKNMSYIIAWGENEPLVFSKNDFTYEFSKITYTVGESVDEQLANDPADYTISADGSTLTFTNAFLKGLLADKHETTVHFNFYYDSSTIKVEKKIKLIDEVTESITDPEELKWKKESPTNLEFVINDKNVDGSGSFIDEEAIPSELLDANAPENTSITLKLTPDYLNGVKLGWHKIEFFFDSVKIPEPPKKPEPQEPEAYRLRLFSDRSAQQGLPINSYSRHVVGWFLVFDDTKIPEKYGPHPEKQPPTPITPDPVPTDPSTNPPVVTPVVPDTPVVPVP
ncbi:MAG: hypothetical protein RRY52_07185, partial [Anaerovoracaceae bacterium]